MRYHRNNFGIMRLFFASCVIIGHSPELLDGNRSREPLTRIFHTVSLGELSVDAFFLISGFLITESMTHSKGVIPFLQRRILRIYPAYIISFLICILLLSPLLGGTIAISFKNVARMLILSTPAQDPSVLKGLPYADLNGSMWTIGYEFRCYVLIGILGITGVLRRPKIVLMYAIIFNVLAFYFPVIRQDELVSDSARHLLLLFGNPSQTFRLGAAFMNGACFFLYRPLFMDYLNGKVAAACAALVILLLFQKSFAEQSLVTIGSLSLFWFALSAQIGFLQKINDKWDISYGTYLYGWPIADLFRYYYSAITPLELALISLTGSLVLGAVSWILIERPMKNLTVLWPRVNTKTPPEAFH